MGVIDRAAFEIARRAVHAYCVVVAPSLDARSRARMIVALDTARGGAMEGALPSAVREAFLVSAPAVDDEVVGSVLRRTCQSLQMSGALETLLRRLAHVARVDGRTALGWPELFLAIPLLEEAGATEVAQALADALVGDAQRIAAMSDGLWRLDVAERSRRRARTDEVGMPLYAGMDGEPTTQPVVEVPRTTERGEPLYVPPPELVREPHAPTAFTERELWDRHFVRQIDGRERMRRWLADPLSRALSRRTLPALFTPLEEDAERLAGRWLDVAEVRSEVITATRTMEMLATLEEGPSALSATAEAAPLRAACRHALDRCLAAVRLLDAILSSATVVATLSPSLARRSLPIEPAMADAVAAEQLGDLDERLSFAVTASRWLRGGATGTPDTTFVAAELLEACARRLVGATIPPGAPPRITAALLRAEAVVRRGAAALTVLADAATPESSEEARRLAIELALGTLSRSLDEALLEVRADPLAPTMARHAQPVRPEMDAQPTIAHDRAHFAFAEAAIAELDVLHGARSGSASIHRRAQMLTEDLTSPPLSASPWAPVLRVLSLLNDPVAPPRWMEGDPHAALLADRSAVRRSAVHLILEIVTQRLGAEAQHGALLDAVGLATAIAGRDAPGLAELALGIGWLEANGHVDPYAPVIELLREEAPAVTALAKEAAQGPRRGVQRTDGAGRLLYAGDDGEPTVEPSWFVMERFRNEPLFHPPHDMDLREHGDRFPLRVSELGLTHRELWERHFVSLPFGERKLEAWVRDVQNIVRRDVARKPLVDWITVAPLGPPIPALDEDALLLRRALAELDAPASSPLVHFHVTGWWRQEVGEARRRCGGDTTASARAAAPHHYAGHAARDLPRAVRAVVIGHAAGSLTERWTAGRAVVAWLMTAPTRGSLPIAWPRASLLETAHAAFADHVSSEGDALAAEAAALCRALFDAEAVAARGAPALRTRSDEPPATVIAEAIALDALEARLRAIAA